MSGYVNDTDGLFIDGEGWLHTGDLGRIDDEGYLYVVDRLKDIIIRGGENIASAQVEGRLGNHPSVSQVAVIGVPNPDLGEEVGAIVVPRPGVTIDVDELAQYARGRLAHFEVPTRWMIRSESLPENATGKVLKRRLLEELLLDGDSTNPTK
jgi:long-chain acyl-CoA synthetase